MQPARITAMLSLLPAGILGAGLEQSLQTLCSQDMRPHFEIVRDRQIFFVEGLPFFVLTAEVPWHQSHYGRDGSPDPEPDLQLRRRVNLLDKNDLEFVRIEHGQVYRGLRDFGQTAHERPRYFAQFDPLVDQVPQFEQFQAEPIFLGLVLLDVPEHLQRTEDAVHIARQQASLFRYLGDSQEGV